MSGRSKGGDSRPLSVETDNEDEIMQHSSRHFGAAISAFVLGLGLALGAALAESGSALINQVKLSEQQVRGYITAQKDLTVIQTSDLRPG